RSEIPALRIGNQKIAKDLHARDRFELFGINKRAVERDLVALPKQLDEPGVLDQIVGQQRDTEITLAGLHDAQDIIDNKERGARAFAIATCLDKPVAILL